MPTHNPIDKNGMTELIDYYNGMSLDKKEGQLVTCGIFYCRDSANLLGCGSLQTSSWVDSDVLRNRQLTIPPTVRHNNTQHMKQTTQLKLFISRPSDVIDELDSIRLIIEEINKT
ncbi:MAG: hypothetical protein PHW82_12120, partial [Bacteroidales bacterium]|nr:hypothetical protein [Bacteroidales bacterium]